MDPFRTNLAEAAAEGELSTTQLIQIIYEDLRKHAERHLSNESKGHTLQATALVHEAFLRIIGPEDSDKVWSGKAEFYGAAAQAMRRVLIDHARKKNAKRRGGGRIRITLQEAVESSESMPAELINLDDAIRRLEDHDAKKAELVRLRFYAGLTVRQAAEVLDLPSSTVSDQWTIARAWLYRELGETPHDH